MSLSPVGRMCGVSGQAAELVIKNKGRKEGGHCVEVLPALECSDLWKPRVLAWGSLSAQLLVCQPVAPRSLGGLCCSVPVLLVFFTR